MEKRMETTIWYIGVTLGLYGDDEKENGSYYFGYFASQQREWQRMLIRATVAEVQE